MKVKVKMKMKSKTNTKTEMGKSERCWEGQASWRWNPTIEQRSILENLYEQGIRTPSAHQIQHITAILSARSHIEAKNVFYWFQNHKVRQRQRQTQNHTHQTLISDLNRFLFSPHTETSFYPRNQRTPQNLKTLPLFPLHPTGILEGKTMEQGSSSSSSSPPSVSADTSTSTSITTPSLSSDVDDEYGRSENPPFFDFFSLGQGSQTV